MSDIADFKYKKESLRESVVNQNGDSITDHYSKFEDNDTTIKDYKQPIDTEDISKTFEHSFDYNFKMKTPSKSAGVIDIHDDNLLSFTSATFKSIENLKLDEKTKIIEDCIIPEMPTGIELCLILMENWGDQNFIGLNGIEILDRFGNRPSIENVFLKNDENRKEYNDLYKLIDNVYRTHDDSHIWQCRFDEKKALPIRIIFRFEKPTTIALIRIWNYNKSRIHSYRGVKYAKVKLDEQTIFCGEIAKACGDLTGTLENFGDTILFTTDEEVLEHISHFDISFQELLMEQMN